MTKYNFLAVALIFTIFFGLTSCSEDEDNPMMIEELNTLNMEFKNLPNLGSDYTYEGWIIVDGKPITAGIFNVDSDGNPEQTSFKLSGDDLEKATAYALTIEPVPDDNPEPSKVHILGGDFAENASNLTTDHPLAMGTDFLDAKGSYLLGTPTDGSLDTDERSGIWWEDLSTGAPLTSLQLPAIAEGWVYEGWVVIDGKPLTTGKFLEVGKADLDAPFSGESPGPPFPGEDFIQNAPDGFTFPLDLSGSITAITVEPSPDNSPMPFSMKTLIHKIPEISEIHTGYDMDNDAINTNPSGRITLNRQ